MSLGIASETISWQCPSLGDSTSWMQLPTWQSMFHRDQAIFQQISTAHRCSLATGRLGGLQLLLPCLPCFQFTSRTKVTEIAVDATGAAFVMPKPCTRLASFWMPRISSERIHQCWRDHIWVFVWRGDESISIHLPRCCIEPLEGAWSCIDATSTYLGDSVSWCETLYAHRTCIIMYHTFSSFSHAFFNALNSNPRNSSKRIGIVVKKAERFKLPWTSCVSFCGSHIWQNKPHRQKRPFNCKLFL